MTEKSKVRRYISKGYATDSGPNMFTVLNADCGCGSDEHRQEVMLSVESVKDEDYPGFLYIDVSIEAKMQAVLDRFAENWFQSVWRRICFAFQALVGGRLDPYIYSTFTFTSRAQLNDYIQTLQEELNAFDAYVEAHNKEQEASRGNN